MSAFKYQWNQTIDVGTAGLLSKQWTSIRHILSLLVTANACVHVTAYVAVRRSLSTTYTAVVLGLLLQQYVSYQFGVWAVHIASIHILLWYFVWCISGTGNNFLSSSSSVHKQMIIFVKIVFTMPNKSRRPLGVFSLEEWKSSWHIGS